MIRHNKIWYMASVALAGVLLGLSGCKDDIVIPDPEPVSGIEIPVVINIDNLSNSAPRTYSVIYPGTREPGSAPENKIENAIVYFFDNAYNCEKVTKAPASSLSVGPTMVQVGLKHIIVLANYIGKFPATGPDTLPTTPEHVNYAKLMHFVTGQASALPTSPFLMVGKKDTTFLDPKSSSAPDIVNIGVERTCAKVRLKVAKSHKAASHNITLKSVTLRRGANRVPLFTWPNPNPYLPWSSINTLNSTPKTDFKLNGVGAPNAVLPILGNGFCELTDTIYTYENLCQGDSLYATQIEIQAEVNNPSNVRTVQFYLGEYVNASNDTTYNVYRNYWYDVAVDVQNPGMDSIKVTVNASRWNEGNHIIDTLGGGFADSVPKPMKFVKYFEASPLPTSPLPTMKADTLKNHSKGGAWLKLKVTKNTPWTLRFKNNDGSQMAEEIGGILSGWSTAPMNGVGDDADHYYYFYRPYVDGAEPKTGNTVILNVGGKDVRSYVIQPRDTLVFPTNSYILRPQLVGVPSNETRVYIPLKHVYSYWEDFLGEKIPNLTTVTIRYPGTGQPVKNVSIIDANRRDSAYVYAEASAIQGNAIIDVKNSSGVVYWSYHLWVTEYNPYKAAGQKSYTTTVNSIKNVFMDRNMGAMTNKYDATLDAKGFYYQWGRKDAFLYSFAIINSTTAPSATAAIKGILNNPATFYSNLSWWNYMDINNNGFPMWCTRVSYKGSFDPCPEGWRVPEQEVGSGPNSLPWEGLLSSIQLNIPGYENGYYHDSVGYYPSSDHMAVTGLVDPTSAHYWTSWNNDMNITNSYAFYLQLPGSSMIGNLTNKICGGYVRCVVDKKYLNTHPNGGLFGNEAPQLINKLK